MKKIKLLTAVLFCLSIAGMASAAEYVVEVINIDLNGNADDGPYSGPGAYEASETWLAYYQEAWGKAMGSPRSASLANYDEPNTSSFYAAQVWIGEDVNHGYVTGSGTGLMDDGFVKDPCVTPDPCLRLWGKDAYAGMYDIYVYGANDGNFTLTNPLRTPTVEVKHVDGWANPGFVPGKNYVVFEDVPVSHDSNYTTLTYDNVLNGLQLVKQPEDPTPLVDPDGKFAEGQVIYVPEYDVAYETNTRSGEPNHFGPDFEEPNGTPIPEGNSCIAYLDGSEYMGYDIIVDEANEGYYYIDAYVNTYHGLVNNLEIWIDDVRLGNWEQDPDLIENPSDSLDWEEYYWLSEYSTGGVIYGNFFEGYHTLKWRVPSQQYFNIARLKIYYDDKPIQMNDCNDVYFYHFNYPGDFTHDCRVDFNDLKYMTDHWLECYSPDANDCL